MHLPSGYKTFLRKTNHHRSMILKVQNMFTKTHKHEVKIIGPLLDMLRIPVRGIKLSIDSPHINEHKTYPTQRLYTREKNYQFCEIQYRGVHFLYPPPPPPFKKKYGECLNCTLRLHCLFVKKYSFSSTFELMKAY